MRIKHLVRREVRFYKDISIAICFGLECAKLQLDSARHIFISRYDMIGGKREERCLEFTLSQQ